jgi:hypothetical protein
MSTRKTVITDKIAPSNVREHVGVVQASLSKDEKNAEQQILAILYEMDENTQNNILVSVLGRVREKRTHIAADCSGIAERATKSLEDLNTLLQNNLLV